METEPMHHCNTMRNDFVDFVSVFFASRSYRSKPVVFIWCDIWTEATRRPTKLKRPENVATADLCVFFDMLSRTLTLLAMIAALHRRHRCALNYVYVSGNEYETNLSR